MEWEDELRKDLLKKALDPEWQMIHRQMGFASPIADVIMLLGEMGEETDDGC